MGWKDKLNEFASKKGFDMLFGMFDKDKSGQLDAKELSGLLNVAIKQAGGAFNVSEEQANMAMKAVDKDGNGQLSKDEVHTIYMQFIQNIDQFIPKN
jgi:Ca2+-binding EF-hand superfamily protein